MAGAVSGELGHALAVLALTASCAQAVLGLLARPPLAAAAAALAQAGAVALAASLALLIAAFVRSDFSFAVVAAHSHSAKPLLYKIAGAWGNHEGSMLLWCLVSSAFGAAFSLRRGPLSLGHWSRTLGVQGLVTAGALVYALILSNPFARLDPAPMEGAGLNPVLQDPALALHPPMLYLGYVGLSLPFSLALAALIEGEAGPAWARALRPWALIAGTCLTLGIALGSYWAYYELGWGGWWFWDPVENASFMPWLAAAALLHAGLVTERRGSLASWTVLLAILGFGLALLGTFLVRSGVLTSVHAFAIDPQRGVAVLVLLALAMGGGLVLYAWRAGRLDKPRGFAALSREGALVANNLGLSVACGTVLIGTLYPLLAEAVTGRLVSVGPPYFNLTFAPLMGALLLLAPLGPLLAWRRGDLGAAARRLALAFAAALGLALGVGLLLAPGWGAALGLGLGAWLVLGALVYLWARAGARFGKLAALPLGIWAAGLAHAGLGVFVLGAVGETSFKQERALLLLPGERTRFAGREVTLSGIEAAEGPNYYADRAIFSVDGRSIAAERRFYPASQTPTSEVAILSSWGGDLYIALGETSREAGPVRLSVRLYFNPMVQLIYGGAALMALGGALALVRRMRLRGEAS